MENIDNQRSSEKFTPLVVGILASIALVAFLALRSGQAPSEGITLQKQRERVVSGLLVGDQAPDFSLPTTEGGSLSLNDFLGQRLGIIFATSRCPYCDELLKRLKTVEIAESQHLLIIAQEGMEGARKIDSTYALDFPILVDSTKAVGGLYDIPGVPTFYLLDGSGEIAKSRYGMERVVQAGATTIDAVLRSL